MISWLPVIDCWKAWAVALAVGRGALGVAARAVMRRMPVPPSVEVSISAGSLRPSDLLGARAVDARLRGLGVGAQQRREVVGRDERPGPASTSGVSASVAVDSYSVGRERIAGALR